MDLFDIFFLIGRLLLGGYFAWTGFHHFLNLDSLTAYAAARGVPFPKLAVLFASPLILFGGLGVLFGVYPYISLSLLVVFMVPVTFMMHAFWKIEDRDERRAARIQFLKNMTILGALLMLYLVPIPWPFSLF